MARQIASRLSAGPSDEAQRQPLDNTFRRCVIRSAALLPGTAVHTGRGVGILMALANARHPAEAQR